MYLFPSSIPVVPNLFINWVKIWENYFGGQIFFLAKHGCGQKKPLT
jgi:hypothetical protein